MSNFDIFYGNDITDQLANNKNYYIDFYHLPTGRNVRFKSFITNFTDNYRSNWGVEEPFGRMDRIRTFQNTYRQISISWKLVSDSEEQAIENYSRLSELVRLLYPTYQSIRDITSQQLISSTTINSPPLFRVKFLNWIQKSNQKVKSGFVGGVNRPDIGGAGGNIVFDQTNFSSADAKNGGLICSIDGCVINPNLDEGMWTVNGNLFAKFVELSMELSIHHEHEMGFGTDGQPLNGFDNFPFGLSETEFESIISDAERRKEQHQRTVDRARELLGRAADARRSQEFINNAKELTGAEKRSKEKQEKNIFKSIPGYNKLK